MVPPNISPKKLMLVIEYVRLQTFQQIQGKNVLLKIEKNDST
jgi:hypothetical protein